MGLSERVDELEKARGPEPCPECGGRIILIEVDSEGARIGGDEPCSVCDSLPPEGSHWVQRIEVMRG